jgi:hypothetical protein
MGLGGAVAVEAEAHAQRLRLAHDVHLVDPAVALDAADAPVDVDRMVEVDEVGGLVDVDPRHRLAGLVAARTTASSGLVVLIWLWQFMHVCAVGISRARAVSTLLWQ